MYTVHCVQHNVYSTLCTVQCIQYNMNCTMLTVQCDLVWTVQWFCTLQSTVYTVLLLYTVEYSSHTGCCRGGYIEACCKQLLNYCKPSEHCALLALMYIVCSMLFYVYCILYSVQCRMYIKLGTMYNVHWKLYIVRYILGYDHCMLYNVCSCIKLCSLYTLHNTMYMLIQIKWKVMW